MAVTLGEIRAAALSLPRTHEGAVRGKVKFYVGRIVFVAIEREGIMGFGHPREWRAAAVESAPAKFEMPKGRDLTYAWLYARMDAIDRAEMTELVTDAWSMAVPRKVLSAYLDQRA